MLQSARASAFSCCDISAPRRIIGGVLSLCWVLLCCPFCYSLSHGHIPAVILLLLMAIRILNQSDFLFSDPGPQFSVHVTDRVPGWHSVLTEYLSHRRYKASCCFLYQRCCNFPHSNAGVMTMTKASACFTVGGISGNHDVKEIKRELDTLPGVRSVTVSNGSLPVMKNGRKGKRISGNEDRAEGRTDFRQGRSGGRADGFPAMKNGRKGRQISGNKEWTEEQTDFQQ